MDNDPADTSSNHPVLESISDERSERKGEWNGEKERNGERETRAGCNGGRAVGGRGPIVVDERGEGTSAHRMHIEASFHGHRRLKVPS